MEHAKEDRIRILVLDAHGLFRAGLAHLIASEPGLEVAGECSSSEEALKRLKESEPQIVLVHLEREFGHPEMFVKNARKNGYKGYFLFLTGVTDARATATAIKFGVSGIFLKSEPPDRLIHAIRTVARGDMWVERKVIEMLANELICTAFSGRRHVHDRHIQPPSY